MKRNHTTRRQTTFIFILILLGLWSCVEEISHGEEIIPDGEGIHSLIVPEGFDYEMVTAEELSVQFSNISNGRIATASKFQYAIIGTDHNDEVHGLKMGFINPLDGLEVVIDKPLHLNQLYLYTKYEGNAKFFDLSSGSLSLSTDDLVVSDDLFIVSNARLSSVPSCTSFLGNATKIVCEDNSIIIKSSASFLYVDVLFIDSQVVRYYPESEGSLNANENQWEFTNAIGSYGLDDALTFTVYADCQTLPQMVGVELVTFPNPCLEQLPDTDQDGVPDVDDVAPADPDVSAVTYYPARNRYATFAFEDLWPYTGDYDFNDLVISHQSTVYTNALDYVTKVDYNFTIRAIGARFNNDLCLSFTDPNHNMIVSEVSPAGVNYQEVELQNLSELRFVRFRELFSSNAFINTDTTKGFTEPIDISVSLLFDGTTSIDDFEVDEFIRINQEVGREVHKPGIAYTSLHDQGLIGYAEDDTKANQGKYYLTKNNLPWALEIPAEWEYPKERIDITEGYPRFKEYAQGNSNLPWYTDENGNKVHKNLYRKSQ